MTTKSVPKAYKVQVGSKVHYGTIYSFQQVESVRQIWP